MQRNFFDALFQLLERRLLAEQTPVLHQRMRLTKRRGTG
jgi:hypothetical protein